MKRTSPPASTNVRRTAGRHCGAQRHLFRLGLAAAFASALAASPSRAADDSTSCFSIAGSGALVVGGDVFRQALLSATGDKMQADTVPQKTAAPATPKRCTGPDTAIPAAGPTNDNYYGTIDNKTKFRRFVKAACNGGSDQYFSIGPGIYYRNCQGGQGNNYIYFWGRPNGNASTCFGSTYPAMFAEASKAKSTPVTVDRMKSAFGGGIAGDDQPTYALGNMMAAILISESARDYLVIAENYMLMDLAAAGQVTPEQIVGGRCVPGATTCGNPDSGMNGVHPLAWGGAQAVMMTGGWGTNNGATSAFGKTFEANLVIKWLTSKGLVAKADQGACTVGKAFGTYTDPQQNAVKALFNSVF
jgi:hypothetical protein